MITLPLLALGLWAETILAGVVVRKTGTAPTGYEVDFTFVNETASRVIIAGGIYPLTDQWHTSWQYSDGWDPRDYQPGDFPLMQAGQSLQDNWPFVMSQDNDDQGTWRYTMPLPSGTYIYAFLVDCDRPDDCPFTSGKWVIDPENPPFVNVPGDQTASTFQVPFDPVFQATPSGGSDLNFDYALPVSDAAQMGTVATVNYTSPGSVHPAIDVHEFTIYLPAGYSNTSDKEYPLLYLSHGGGGNGEDWQNLARMSNIMDRLISQGHIEPTVVVMPSFYNIAPEYNFTYGVLGGTAPSAPVVRENYFANLFPFVEATYRVSRSPSRRAFAGLSLGGRLTYEMYINATDYFDYFGIFSGARINSTATALVPRADELKSKGVMNSYGLYDTITFDVDRSIEVAMNAAGIRYISRIQPWGLHYWNTWQDCLWHFGRRALWQPLPFGAATGRNVRD